MNKWRLLAFIGFLVICCTPAFAQQVMPGVQLFYPSSGTPASPIPAVAAATASPWPNASGGTIATGPGSSGPAAPVICDQIGTVNGITANSPFANGATGRQTYICGFYMVNSGTAQGTFSIRYSSTPTTCTSMTALTPAVALTVGTPTFYGGTTGLMMVAPANDAVCIVVAASGTMTGWINYAQF